MSAPAGSRASPPCSRSCSSPRRWRAVRSTPRRAPRRADTRAPTQAPRPTATSPTRRRPTATERRRRRLVGRHAGAAAPVRGLAVADDGLRLVVPTPELRRGRRDDAALRDHRRVRRAVRDFDVTHERRMHLIVVRRDLTGFQHLHPEQDADGRWSTPVTLPEAGSYRVLADFTRDGEAHTLASDLRVDGPRELAPLRAGGDRDRRRRLRRAPGLRRGPAGARPSCGSRSRATASPSGRSPTSAPPATSSRCARATSRSCTSTPRATTSRSRRRSRAPAATACSCSSSTSGRVHTAAFTVVAR